MENLPEYIHSFSKGKGKGKGKGKEIHVQAYYRPGVFQELQASTLHDSRHMNLVRLSALCTGHLHSPEIIPGTHFC